MYVYPNHLDSSVIRLISVDSNKLSLTIKGLLIGLIPLIIIIAKSFNVELSQAELTETIEAIFLAVAGITTAWGLIRKVIVKFK